MKKIAFIASLVVLFLFADPVFAQVIIAPPFPRDPVVLVPGLVASYNRRVLFKDQQGGSWNFFPFGNIYEGLISRLEDVDYTYGDNFFIAFYDWRHSNEQSATEYLAPIIAEAKERSVSGKVDIIAHSMGGLLVQEYIKSDAYTEGEIDQFIMMGTPNDGSSNAYLPWEGGILPPTWNIVIRSYVEQIEKSLKKTHSIIQSAPITYRQFFPSLKELLPTGAFITKRGDVVPRGDLVEQNPFLETLESYRDALIGERGITVTTMAGTDEATLHTIALENSRTDADIELGRWRDGHPIQEIPQPNTTDGDQTVLESSALFDDNFIRFPGVSHTALPEEAQNEVLTALGVLDEGPKQFIYEEPDWLTGFVVLSPVDIVITDENGKTVSRDTNDFGEDAFVEIEQEAEEPATTAGDDPKVIILRNLPPATYTVHLTGTDTGPYTVITTHTNDTTSESETLTGNTTLGKEEIFTAVIGNEGESIQISDIVELKEITQRFLYLYGRMPTIHEWNHWMKKNNYTVRMMEKMRLAIERWRGRQ